MGVAIDDAVDEIEGIVFKFLWSKCELSYFAVSTARKWFLLMIKLLLLLLYWICDVGCVSTWFILIILVDPSRDDGRSCDILEIKNEERWIY